jgi:NAD(P)-dependent dehydrogenase (short-subunit alcohol dehydrogenase family)
MKTIEDTTEADFDSTFALNVKGPYFLVQVRNHQLLDSATNQVDISAFRKLHHT